MDIKETIAKFSESPAAYRERLQHGLTKGYTYEWQSIESYQAKGVYTAASLLLTFIVLALVTVLSSLVIGIYCLLVLGAVLYIASAITAPILADDSVDRQYSIVAYVMAAMFYFMFGFFGAAFANEVAWAWVALIFGIGAMLINFIVRLIFKSDLITTLRWTIPLFALFDATVTKKRAEADYAKEKAKLEALITKYEEEFSAAASELMPRLIRSKFILDASEYFEGEMLQLLKSYKPSQDEDDDEDTSIEGELVVSYSGFTMGKRTLDFERAKIKKPEAAVELMGLAMALSSILIKDALPYADEIVGKKRSHSLTPKYTSGDNGDNDAACVTITFRVWNPAYDSLGSIYDILDESLGGKQ